MTTTLMERAKTIQEAEHQDNEAWRAELLAQYTAILRRQDDSQPADAQNLLELARDLGLTPGQVEADCKTVARFQRLSTEAAQLDERHAKMVTARENFKHLRQESEKAVQVADAEQAKASNRASAAMAADAEVKRMRMQHPNLFP